MALKEVKIYVVEDDNLQEYLMLKIPSAYSSGLQAERIFIPIKKLPLGYIEVDGVYRKGYFLEGKNEL